MKRHTTGRRNVGKVQQGTFDRGPEYVQLFGAGRSCRCPIKADSPFISPYSVLCLSLSFRKRKDWQVVSCRYLIKFPVCLSSLCAISLNCPIKLDSPLISPHSVLYLSLLFRKRKLQTILCRCPIKLNSPFVSPHCFHSGKEKLANSLVPLSH